MGELARLWGGLAALLRRGAAFVRRISPRAISSRTISSRKWAGLSLAGILGVSILLNIAFDGLSSFGRLGLSPEARLCRQIMQGSVGSVLSGELPKDFGAVADIGCRKRIFVQVVLSLVQAENAEINQERERLTGLLAALDSGEALSWSQQRSLKQLASRYRGRARNPAALLDKVDIIPASLAVAQAAVESAWGRSRFFREGNALYGQQTRDVDNGLVPTERPDGARYLVRSFKTLRASVRAYLDNLNTHPAYGDFRALRADMRRAGTPLDGPSLVGTLLAYSERGEDYIGSLRTIMRVNGLGAYDAVPLSSPNDRL